MSSARYRFGLYEFDAASGELRREGAPVRLQAQPAQMLAYLLARAGQVVTRDELRQAIWGNGTYVDFDRGLNFCASQVRAALRDDAAEPIFIRTVPKRGYAFIAPVEIVATRNHGDTGSHRVADRAPRPAIGAVALALGMLCIVAVAALFWVQARQRVRSTPIVAVLRFDNETGDPAVTRLSDALTDNLVERLTSLSAGEYKVIGNAQILRVPREQRDLRAVGGTLNAAYVVFGQVQRDRERTRILAHLIRLPEQTHLTVVRMDDAAIESLDGESDVAQKIALQLSHRVGVEAARRGPLYLPIIH
jgi:DNA-binding winged helix-turn-helix (wHTH) protein/TolB-like protein